MSELFILRHGKAENPVAATGWSDRARRLTEEGVKRIEAMIPAMQRLDMVPDLIVSSPYPRAAETARIVQEGLNIRQRLQYLDALGADQSVMPFFEHHLSRFIETTDRLMLVGHEPILSQLASLLMTGNPAARIQLKKGAIIHMESRVTEAGCLGMLKGFWTSKQLRCLDAR